MEYGRKCTILFNDAIFTARQELNAGNTLAALQVNYDVQLDEYTSDFDMDHLSFHLHGGGAALDQQLLQAGDRSFVNCRTLMRFVRNLECCPCLRIFPGGNVCEHSNCPRNLQVFRDMERIIRQVKLSARPKGYSMDMPMPEQLAKYRTEGYSTPTTMPGIYSRRFSIFSP